MQNFGLPDAPLKEATQVKTAFQISRRSFVLSAMCLAACKPGTAMLELTGNTMGTQYSIAAVDSDGSVSRDDLQAAVESSLARINELMSNWDDRSEVSRFNASRNTEPQTVSTELAHVISAAEHVHAQSNGYFDVTLGPVIEAWGFGANSGAAQSPDDDTLAFALQGTGQSRLRVASTTLQKTDPGTQVYLSSIGKGFGVDAVAEAIASLGLTDFMVEIGGDLYVSGKNASANAWQIGIESPDALSRSVYEVASVSNMGMATSGDYRNFFEEGGQRFSHIIDPHTGRPVTHNTASVTVLAENAMLADAWATALLAMGSERGVELANSLDLAALFIERDVSGTQVKHTKVASRHFTALQT
jgi:thiamine biosynthesis lipoprotein